MTLSKSKYHGDLFCSWQYFIWKVIFFTLFQVLNNIFEAISRSWEISFRSCCVFIFGQRCRMHLRKRLYVGNYQGQETRLYVFQGLLMINSERVTVLRIKTTFIINRIYFHLFSIGTNIILSKKLNICLTFFFTNYVHA